MVTTLRADAEGGASLIDARGDVVLHVKPPIAVDAEGHRVASRLEVAGLNLSVVLREGDLAYPVLRA